MKTAVLFSGGKDSMLALTYAKENSDVACLITLVPTNKASYMFHTPNIKWTMNQARQLGIPLIMQETEGVKEKELKELESGIKKAVKDYQVKGIVTGAIASAYQSSRVQKICNKLKIECFNPLWQKDQLELLHELLERKFEVIIVGVYAEGLGHLAGKKLDYKLIDELKELEKKYKINIAGEGGEMESFVLNSPMFKKSLIIKKSRIEEDEEKGKTLVIEELE